VKKTAQRQMAACADVREFDPTGCPFAYDTYEDNARDPRWSLPQGVDVAVRAESDGTAWVQVTGTAHLDFVYDDWLSESRSAGTDDEEISLYGTATFDAEGTPTITWD
jgi:hypothetical protein